MLPFFNRIKTKQAAKFGHYYYDRNGHRVALNYVSEYPTKIYCGVRQINLAESWFGSNDSTPHPIITQTAVSLFATPVALRATVI